MRYGTPHRLSTAVSGHLVILAALVSLATLIVTLGACEVDGHGARSPGTPTGTATPETSVAPTATATPEARAASAPTATPEPTAVPETTAAPIATGTPPPATPVAAEAPDSPAEPETALASAERAPAASAVTDAASHTVADEVIVELRLWQHVDDPRDIWISARPAGGRWDALGTIPFPLDTHGFSLHLQSFHWFRDLTIARTELRVWQRHRAPELFYVRACVMRCANWLKPFTQTNPRTAREVAEAWPPSADGRRVYGWSPLGMIPLRLDHGQSSSGRYRYGDLTVRCP